MPLYLKIHRILLCNQISGFDNANKIILQDEHVRELVSELTVHAKNHQTQRISFTSPHPTGGIVPLQQ
jgi:hypothetical protein